MAADLELTNLAEPTAPPPAAEVPAPPAQAEQAKPAPTDSDSVFIAREKLVGGVTTERPVKQPRFGRRPREIEQGEVEITKQMRTERARYLKHLVERIQDFKNSSAHENDWQDGLPQSDRDLYAMLTDKDGGIMDDAKLDAFLKTEQGIIISTEIMERGGGIQLLELGLQTAAHGPAVEQEIPRAGITIRPGEGGRAYRGMRGEIHRALTHMKDHPIWSHVAGAAAGANLGPLVESAGRAVTSVPADALTSIGQSLVGPEALGALGGTILANVLVRRAPDGTSDITLDSFTDVLQEWQGPQGMNQAQRDYLKMVYGLDIDGFVVNQQGQVELAPNSQSINVRQVFDNVESTLQTLNDFYTELGKPQQHRRGRVPHQLLGPRENNESQIITTWRQEIEHRMQQDGTPAERAIAYAQAQEEYLGEKIRDYTTEVLNKRLIETSREENLPSIEDIEAEIADLTSPDAEAKWSAEHQSRQKEFEEDAKFLVGEDGKSGELSGFDGLSILQKQLDELNLSIVAELSGYVDTTNITTAGQLLQEHNRLLFGVANVPGTLAFRRIEIDEAQKQALAGLDGQVDETTQGTNQQGQVITQERKVSQTIETKSAKFVKRLEDIDEISKTLHKQRLDLQKKIVEITKKQAEIAEYQRQNLREPIRRFQTAYNAVIALGVSPDQAATQDIYELMEQAGITRGERWQRTHHEQFTRAMVEARVGRTLLQDVTLGQGARDAYRHCLLAGFGEEDLRTMTADEINQRATELNDRDPNLGWPVNRHTNNLPLIRSAQAVALKTLELRADVIKTLASELSTRSRHEGEMTDPRVMRERRGRLEVVRDAMEDTERTSRVRKTFGDPALRDHALEIAPVPQQGGNYTQAERTFGAPQGHYELMDLIFNYRHDLVNGESRFRSISQLISQNDLLEILLGSPHLVLPPLPANVTLADVFTAIQQGMAGGDIDSRDMREVGGEILDYSRSQLKN